MQNKGFVQLQPIYSMIVAKNVSRMKLSTFLV